MAKYNLEFWFSTKEPPYDEWSFNKNMTVNGIYADGPASKDMLDIIKNIVDDELGKENGWKGYKVAVMGSGGGYIKSWEKSVKANSAKESNIYDWESGGSRQASIQEEPNSPPFNEELGRRILEVYFHTTWKFISKTSKPLHPLAWFHKQDRGYDPLVEGSTYWNYQEVSKEHPKGFNFEDWHVVGEDLLTKDKQGHYTIKKIPGKMQFVLKGTEIRYTDAKGRHQHASAYLLGNEKKFNSLVSKLIKDGYKDVSNDDRYNSAPKKANPAKSVKRPTKIVISTLFTTPHLAMQHADYMTVARPGKPSKPAGWDYVTRVEKEGHEGEKNAVQVIAIDQKTGKLLMIKQFRIPVNKFVISFPGGLIKARQSITDAAKAELLEETGYGGWEKLVSVSPISPKSAGLTDEGGATVVCIIDKAKVGKQKLQDDENIEYFWQTPAAFLRSVKDLPKDTVVSGGVYGYCSAFVQGLKAGRVK